MPEEQNTEDKLTEYREILIRKRKEAGLSINAAAGLAGVTPHTWKAVETGIDNNGKYRGASLNFVIKAAQGLGNWNVAEALELAGHDPAAAPPDETRTSAARVMALFNTLTKRQQQAVLWTMDLMRHPNAAVPGMPVPPSDRVTPVFAAADTDHGHIRNRR